MSSRARTLVTRSPALLGGGRRVAAAAIAALLCVGALGCGATAKRSDPVGIVASAALTGRSVSARPAASVANRTSAPAARFAVGERTLTFVDHSRRLKLPGRRPGPRTLVTVVRYPTSGPASRTDVRDAPPAHAVGGFPLVVFGHGFAVTPATYFRLLQAWAHAGYVVAAPVFPRENANAPGGPYEPDIVNEPRDMSFVITRMLAASRGRRSPLAGLIAPGEIAVSGQSDGGVAALAVAYDRPHLDTRVRAAVILSGAQFPNARFASRRLSPPLLATQGTADTINRPQNTYSFFAAAQRPKYLLKLLGAPHLPPYTEEQPQLTIVERVTTAFLDRYLKGQRAGTQRMRAAARAVPGATALISDP